MRFIEYKKHFLAKDEQHLKMSLRQIKCYLSLKDVENAEKTLNEIEASITNEDFKNEFNKQLNQLNQIKNDSKKSGLRFKFNLKSPETYDYDWNYALKEINTNCIYDNGILNMLNKN